MDETLIALRGRSSAAHLRQPLARRVWRLAGGDSPASEGDARLYDDADADDASSFPLYIAKHGTSYRFDRDVIELPTELDYLSPGDILAVSPDGASIRVLWRRQSRQNHLLLTERCDNYCLMCSQPPRTARDDYHLDDAFETIRLLPDEPNALCFTGGEPTLYGDRFLQLLKATKEQSPQTEVHILSNGRRFSDPAFTRRYSEVDNPTMMIGIPLYGAEADLHDYIVQSEGAFDETVRGILNLAAHGQRIEIRIVIQKHTAPALMDIAEFISRNLPFVEQVALMGLEMTGLARPNVADVWIDPFDYKVDIADAAFRLHHTGIRTLIYNHQLCVLAREAWPFAVRSISDWKNEYDPVCQSCDVADRCGGFFHSAMHRASAHIAPVFNEQHDSSTPSLPADNDLRRHPDPVHVEWRARTVATEPMRTV